MAKEDYTTLPCEWDDDRKMQWIHNHERVIYRAIQSYRRQYEMDDLRQLALEATLLAFEKFDPNRGAQLITYAYNSIINTLNMQVRNDRAQKRSAVLVPLHGDSVNGRPRPGYDNLDLSAICEGQPDIEKTVEEADTVAALQSIIRRKIDPENRAIFEMMLSGKTQNEIAQSLGCSQAKVSNAIRMCRIRILYEAKKVGLYP